jgi:lipopolysaccharide export system permease protein
MGILDRHIGKTIIGSTLVVVLVLLGMQSFIEFVTELQDIGKGNYGVLQALVYVPLSLPKDLYQLFPVAGLIGSLIGLGRLASQSELIVMRAAGVSKMQITCAVIKATIVMLIFATAIGEIVAPPAKKFAENYKTSAESGRDALQPRQGVWLRDGNNFIHINTVTPKGQLQGIVRYQFQQQHLLLASVARLGMFQEGQWVFTKVRQTEFFNHHTVTQNFAQQIWPVSFDPNLLGLVSIQTDQATLLDLHNYINYLKGSGLLASQYQFALWKRLLQPFATLVMICLAIPFIFGPLRTVTMGLRILIGVVIGFGFYTLNEFFGPFSMVYQIPPIWAASIPIVLFGIIDAFLLWRIR